MSTLSKKQALALALYFKEFAVSVSTRSVSSWKRLTDEERQQLNSLEWTLFNASEDMLTLTTSLALDDLETELEAIQEGARKAKAAVDKVSKIKRVIEIAAAATTLAAAVLSKNPAAISTALQGLSESISGEADDKKSGGKIISTNDIGNHSKGQL